MFNPAVFGSLLSAAGFGAANVVIKKSLSSISITRTLALSLGFSALYLLGLTLVTGESLADTVVNYWPQLLAFGIVEVLLYITVYKAFAAANVTVASAIMSVYPILSLFTAVIFLNEAFSLVRLLLIFVLIFGVILTSIDWRGVRRDGLDLRDVSKGFGWIMLAVVTHAIYFPVLGEFTGGSDWEPRLAAVKVVAFALMLGASIWFHLRGQKDPINRQQLVAGSVLGLLETIGWVGISLGVGASPESISLVVALGSASPFFTAIFARILLKERLSALQYVGLVVVVCGLVLLSLQKL